MTTSRSYLSAIFLEPGVRGPEAAWDFNLKAFEAFERVPIDDAELICGADKVLRPIRNMRCAEGGAA